MPEIGAIVSRRESRARGRWTASMRGFLASLPRVGEPLVLFAKEGDGSVARMVTSFVDRILRDSDGALFVETHRSTYRVVLDEPQVDLPPPIRIRVSLDGFALTVAPANSSDEALEGADPID